MDIIGKSLSRVDAKEKVTGTAKYTGDLVSSHALIAKVLHSEFANGTITSFDLSEAWKVPGVVDIVTCFDVPSIQFPTAGHPWSTDKKHQDIADRLLLNRRVTLGFFPWRFVDGESSIGRCVAFVDDAEYEQLMERKKGMPKTKHGDCFEPAHVENLNRLTRANLGL